MRISSANITYQANKLPASNPSPAADKSTARQQEIGARDSYNKNAGTLAQGIIDAEYVDFYTPSTGVFNRERQGLDNTIEAGISASSDRVPTVSGYQLSPHEAPPPGSYIDLFV